MRAHAKSSRIAKLALAGVLAVMLGCGALLLAPEFAANGAQKAYASDDITAASTSKNMKQLGVKFDLKKNKAMKFKVTHLGYNYKTKKIVKITQPFTAKVTNMKVKNASKKGYKQATFNVSFSSSWKPSKSQVDYLWIAYSAYEKQSKGLGPAVFGSYCTVVSDFVKLVNLESKNACNVTVKNDKGSIRYKKFKGSGTDWIKLSVGNSWKVSITYPSSYKNLCFGIGGNLAPAFLGSSQYKADHEFFKNSDSKHLYTTTSYYKKSKSNFHFLRIS